MEPKEVTKLIRPIAKSNKYFSKIFCIGANKTGTTTLAATLEIIGYKVPNQMDQEMHISKQTYLGNYDPFKEYISKYDVFQDIPFSIENFYIVADALFPNSLFILTERDSDKWYNSLINYDKKKYKLDNLDFKNEEDIDKKFFYLFEGYRRMTMQKSIADIDNDKLVYNWKLLYDKDHLVKNYITRNNEIKKYFHHRKNFLILDLDKERNNKRLCEFLNIPSKYSFDYPHLNKTEEL
jgi:hypothetical protein